VEDKQLATVVQKRRSLHKTLAERQDENAELRCQNNQLQAYANIGSATCMIAHEINNLLAPLANYAAMALKNPEEHPLVRKALEKTVRNCEQASKIMQSVLAMANGQEQQREHILLRVLVEEVFGCLSRDFAKDVITVVMKIPEDLMIKAVPVQIQHVLMNLILNARDAMLERGGVLTIRASEDTDTVCIEVSDTGTGINRADLQHIFEAFYTTKRSHDLTSEYSGSGIGLAFCKRIIEEHQGSISVESTLGCGTTFKIALPKL
jgi:signal transduction histidine kinase